MDNASKALIIAGAILIAVMLVSLGVMIYNTSAGVAEDTVNQLGQMGAQAFNARFETYFGTRDKQQASGLVRAVIANNGNDDTPNVSINGSSDASTLADLDATIQSQGFTTKYTIKATSYNEGYISEISISGGSVSGGETPAGG